MINFSVPGQPVAKGRSRSVRRGNKIGHYTPQATVSYENLVRMAAWEKMQGKQIISGPAKVDISLFFKIPQSWAKNKRLAALSGEIMPTIKPDCSNVLKAIEDALNGVVWDDDKQVIEVIVRKFYSENPRAVVMVEPF